MFNFKNTRGLTMAKYKIEKYETWIREVEVNANSEEEALEKLEMDEDIISDHTYYSGDETDETKVSLV